MLGFLRRVDHSDQCDAQVYSQTVDVEEAEERQQREDKSARRELYSDTPATRARLVRPITPSCTCSVCNNYCLTLCSIFEWEKQVAIYFNRLL